MRARSGDLSGGMGLLNQKPADKFERVDDPLGRGGVGILNMISGALSNYVAPEKTLERITAEAEAGRAPESVYGEMQYDPNVEKWFQADQTGKRSYASPLTPQTPFWVLDTANGNPTRVTDAQFAEANGRYHQQTDQSY